MKSKIIEPSNTTGNQKGGLRNEKKSNQFYDVGSPYIVRTSIAVINMLMSKKKENE